MDMKKAAIRLPFFKLYSVVSHIWPSMFSIVCPISGGIPFGKASNVGAKPSSPLKWIIHSVQKYSGTDTRQRCKNRPSASPLFDSLFLPLFYFFLVAKIKVIINSLGLPAKIIVIVIVWRCKSFFVNEPIQGLKCISYVRQPFQTVPACGCGDQTCRLRPVYFLLHPCYRWYRSVVQCFCFVNIFHASSHHNRPLRNH